MPVHASRAFGDEAFARWRFEQKRRISTLEKKKTGTISKFRYDPSTTSEHRSDPFVKSLNSLSRNKAIDAWHVSDFDDQTAPIDFHGREDFDIDAQVVRISKRDDITRAPIEGHYQKSHPILSGEGQSNVIQTKSGTKTSPKPHTIAVGEHTRASSAHQHQFRKPPPRRPENENSKETSMEEYERQFSSSSRFHQTQSGNKQAVRDFECVQHARACPSQSEQLQRIPACQENFEHRSDTSCAHDTEEAPTSTDTEVQSLKSTQGSHIIESINIDQLQSISFIRAPPPAVSLIIGTLVQSVFIWPYITAKPSANSGTMNGSKVAVWSVCRHQLRVNSSKLLRTLHDLSTNTLSNQSWQNLENLANHPRLQNLDSLFMQPLQHVEQYECVLKLWKWLKHKFTEPRPYDITKEDIEYGEAPKRSSRSIRMNSGFRMRNLKASLFYVSEDGDASERGGSYSSHDGDDDESVNLENFFGGVSLNGSCSGSTNQDSVRSDGSFFTATDDLNATDDECAESLSSVEMSVEICGLEEVEVVPPLFPDVSSGGSNIAAGSITLTPTSFFAIDAVCLSDVVERRERAAKCIPSVEQPGIPARNIDETRHRSGQVLPRKIPVKQKKFRLISRSSKIAPSSYESRAAHPDD